VKYGMIVGMVYGLISLIFVPFFVLMIGLSTMAQVASGQSQHAGLGIVGGILMMIFLPIFYTVLGGLFGMLGAFLYNLVAGWIGGIEFEVE
jgi:hypothetical protein